MNAPEAAAAPAAENPFIGVRPYPEGRALYGREQESAELADLLISRRIVLLYSPSGAGKTSLMNTALRRDLALRGKGRFRPSKAVRVGYLGEVEAPNRYVLSALHYLEKSLPDAEQLPDSALAKFTLPGYLAERWTPAMQALDERTRRDVLVFDQFEELFTLDPTDLDAKRAFLAQVAEALGDRDDGEDGDAPRVPLRWAIFAMREDFIAELDPYKGVLPTALATRFRLNLLGRDAAKRVILCTAADAGADFGEDAIDRIVADLARVRAPRGAPGEWIDGPFVEPVQLQVVCRRLWSKHMRDGKYYLRPEDLTATADGGDDARALGAVDDALAQFYADCTREAAGGSTTRERAIRDWIEQALVSKAKLRCQVMLDPGSTLPIEESALSALGGTLLRKETRGGRDWIELTHDRLIEPLLWDNNRWRGEHLSLLQMQAYLWDAAGRIDGYLLTGAALEQSATWARTHDHELSDVDRAFLTAALKSRDDESSRRMWRVIRNVLTGGTVVMVLLMVGTYLLYKAMRVAEGERDNASRESKLSALRDSLSQADVLRGRDPIGSISAALASAGQIETLASSAERSAPTVPERVSALVRSIRAALPYIGEHVDVDRSDPAMIPRERTTVEASLLDAMRSAPPVTVRFAGHHTAVRRVLFVDKGRVVSVGYDGVLRLWNAEDGRPITESKPAGPVLFAAEYHAGRSLIADGDGAGHIRLWKLGVGSLDLVATIKPEASRALSRITGLAFLEGGNVLVASTWDRRLLFFDISRPEAPKHLTTRNAPASSVNLYSLAASGDGRMLATGSWDGTVTVWRDLPTLRDPDRMHSTERLTTQSGDERLAINAVAFSSRGRYLAAGGHDGSVFLWEAGPNMARSMKRLQGDGGHKGAVSGVAFDAEETRLASVAIDRRVLVWPLDEVRTWKAGTKLPLDERFPPLPERLYGIAFDPQREDTLALAAGPSVFLVDLRRPVSPLVQRLYADGQKDSWVNPWQAIAITDDATIVAGSRRIRAGDGADAPPRTQVVMWTRGGGGLYGPPKDKDNRIRQEVLTRVAMNGDGSVMVTGDTLGAVTLWRDDGKDGTLLRSALGHRVVALAVSRDGRTVAASLANGEEALLMAWRLAADGKVSLLGSEPLAAQRIRALAFDSRGATLAAGASDGSVHVWSVTDDGIRAIRSSRAVQPSEINVIAFTPDDKRIATGAEDSTIAFWSLPELDADKTLFTEHRGAVVSLAFCSARGQTQLFSSDRDGEVIARLSLNDARHIRTLMESFGRPRYLAATPDCRHLVTSGASALVWDLDADSVLRQACALANTEFNPLPACNIGGGARR